MDKPPNKTEIIDAHDLLEEPEKTDDQYDESAGCPYIIVGLEKQTAKLLIDTGAEITVISDKILKEIEKEQENIPTLPVVGVTIHGVIPRHTTKIKKQVMVKTTVMGTAEDVTFLVIEGLQESGILGTDFLDSHGVNIDYDSQTVRLTFGGMDIEVPFEREKRIETIQINKVDMPIVRRETRQKEKRTPMNEETQERLDALIDDFAEVFREEPGLVRGFESKLRLRTNDPVYQRPYTIPVSRQKAVADEIERMIQMGIIERSRSPYSIPIVPVFKKNGEVRLCVDARKLNSQIIPDRERPIPVEDVLLRFRSAKYMRTVDLRSGYWQVPLEESSRAACSFLFNGRNYSFTRMPFWLNVSGCEFQKCMDFVLGPAVQEFVTIYVNDIIIMSSTLEEHYEHLRRVFRRFKEYNVTVNLEKCKFFQSEVKFLGHIISTEGIRMDPEKVEAVMRFRPPINKREVQKYLGFLNFYRKYIKGFADLIQPLTELLKKGHDWE